MEGLRDANLRTFVLTRRPEGFEAAVAEGEWYEDNLSGRCRRGVTFFDDEKESPSQPVGAPRNSRAAPRRDADPIAELIRSMELMRLQLAQIQPRSGDKPVIYNRPAAGGTCYRYGQAGHVARDCPQPREDRRRSSEPTGGVNYIEEEAQAEWSDEEGWWSESEEPPEAYYYRNLVYAQEKRAREDASDFPAPAPRRFRPVPFDPENLPDAPPPRAAPGRTGPAATPCVPARTQTAVQPRGRAPPPGAEQQPTWLAPRPVRTAPGPRPAAVAGRDYNVVTQLDATPAKVYVGELVRVSPAHQE